MFRLFNDIKKYWKYIIYAAKADLVSEVTNAYLDWFWWILEPVCNMFIYYFIFGFVFHNEEQYYLVFIYSGITMWTFFSRMLSVSVELVRNSRSIISKVYIPKPIILIQKMFVNGFKMLISSAIVVVLMIPYRVSIDWHLILLVPVIILFLILVYGICCFLMHYGVYVDDLSYIVSIVLKMLMYFTGVFYSVADKFPQPYGVWFERMNPIAFLIASMRNALLYMKGFSFTTYILWFAVAVIIGIVGTLLIYKNENSYVKVI